MSVVISATRKESHPHFFERNRNDEGSLAKMTGDDDLKLPDVEEPLEEDVPDAEVLAAMVAASDECCQDVISTGDVVDGWQVKNEIGFGPRFRVYRVERNGEAAVLKLLTCEDESERLHFTHEIAFIRDHELPCLPHFIASGECQDYPYFICELLEEIKWPFESFVAIRDYLLAVCDAVSCLHAKGYVHRDLESSKIMRRANGEIVLIGFRSVEPISGAAVPGDGLTTMDGKIAGSVSPDAAASKRSRGGRFGPEADIHALGMLARDAFIESHCYCEGWRDPIPEILQDVIHRALHFVSGQYYPSVAAFAAAIREGCGKWTADNERSEAEARSEFTPEEGVYFTW